MINIHVQNPNKLNIPNIEKIKEILISTLNAINPEQIINNSVRFQNDFLFIKEIPYQISNFRNIYLIGIGKASQLMAIRIMRQIGNLIHSGLVIAKVEEPLQKNELLPKIVTIQSSHPIPDEKSIFAAEEIIRFSKKITANDLVICLISGGGSALVTKPVEGLSLKVIQDLTLQLLRIGATINEINTIRKHLDVIKGGGLLSILYPAHVVTLILSDVMGDDLSMIASGPTVPDPTTYQDALNILHKYSITEGIDKNIIRHLNSGKNGIIAETLKENDPRFSKVQNIVIGNNLTGLLAAKQIAENVGYQCEIITEPLIGDTCDVGRKIAQIIKEKLKNEKIEKPLCIISGGESTVNIKGRGHGGRNQEVALYCAVEIDGLNDVCVATLATDGEDGPTDAAGAIITGQTIQSARMLGIDAKNFLNNNDSYHFFDKVGGLIKTGSTGTNVNDINLIFIN